MDDYISREAAIKKFEDAEYLYDPEPGAKRYTVEDAKEILNDVPAADVRPVVRGRWGVVSFRNVRTGVLEKCVCSVCSFTETYFKEPNFCPNCGADMRTIGQRLSDISTEEDLFPELTAEEKAENKAEAKRMIGGADG